MSRTPRRPRPNPTSSTPITIRILGGTAEVTYAPRRVLMDTLVCAATCFAGGGPLGHRHAQGIERHWIDGATADTVIIPTGLVTRLVVSLQAAGFRIEIVDLRRYQHAADGLIAAAPKLGGTLALAIANHPRGLVEAQGGDAVQIAGGIAQLYPTARVLVATKNRKQSRTVFRRLRRLLGHKEVGHGHDQTGGFTSRVQVITLPRLGQATPDDFEVVVALDAAAAVRHVGEAGLRRLGGGRVYGCVAPGVTRSRREQLSLEAYCGPMLHREPKVGQFVGVRVVMAIPPWSPPPGDCDALAQKRARWHDTPRNGFVAGVALAIAARDGGELCRLGLLSVSSPLPRTHSPRIVVLVETPEHGRGLRCLLPGWPLVIAGMLDTALPTSAIVTLAATAERLSVDADVLVRADGGHGSIPAAFPPRRAFPGSEVVLVDLADDADAVARRATATRVAAYDARGWEVEGRLSWMRLAR